MYNAFSRARPIGVGVDCTNSFLNYLYLDLNVKVVIDLLVENIAEQNYSHIYKANTLIPALLYTPFRTRAHPMVSAEVVTNL